MKLRFSIFGLVFILTACITTPQIAEDTTKYEFLWDKQLLEGDRFMGREGCVSAFHDGSFLYLVSYSSVYGSRRYASVSAYDPRTGIFTTVEFEQPIDVNFSCSSVLLAKEPTKSYARLNTMISSEFKSIFDGFLTAPDALKEAVTASVERYYREGKKWDGKLAASNLDERGAFPLPIVRRVNDLAVFLRGIDVKKAQRYVAERKSFLDRAEREIERRAQYAQETISAKQEFRVDRQQNRPNEKPRDEMGREIIKGPVGSGYYNNVRIISDSVGVEGNSVTVINSVIEAPLCIRTDGQGTTVRDNDLLCNLCIEFTSNVLIGNVLMNNRCSGRGTNRPDVFGW